MVLKPIMFVYLTCLHPGAVWPGSEGLQLTVSRWKGLVM